MSSFVLKRNYELQLPNSFVDVDREEMEYVDGGAYISNGELTNFLYAFGCSAIVQYAQIGYSSYAIASKLKAVFTIVRAGLASTGWGIAIAAYLGWKGGSFIDEFAKALDMGKGLYIGWGWTGPYFEAR